MAPKIAKISFVFKIKKEMPIGSNKNIHTAGFKSS